MPICRHSAGCFTSRGSLFEALVSPWFGRLFEAFADAVLDTFWLYTRRFMNTTACRVGSRDGTLRDANGNSHEMSMDLMRWALVGGLGRVRVDMFKPCVSGVQRRQRFC